VAVAGKEAPLKIGGLYALAGAESTTHRSLAEVCRRVPKGVVCQLSVLQFHEIGTQIPHEVWLAVPEGTQTPAVDYPPLRIVRLRGEAYDEGIESFIEAGSTIRAYSLEKTIADCFKFRNKIGLDVALEALKDAWSERKLVIDRPIRFARINRVERVLQPYLEAVVA
jgi:predicted transcriptional regulator of viral defense system